MNDTSNSGEFTAGKLLSTINLPSDLRKLHEDQLPQLSKELRQYIIDLVSKKGRFSPQ